MKAADSRPNERLRFPTSRMAVIFAMMALMMACASQPGSNLQPLRASMIAGCPKGSVRTCEVIGGNKFRKRYGRCVCALW
jgi:hypothetical protein